MTQRIVVIGAGGMGRCVLDVIDAVNVNHSTSDHARLDVLGVLDDIRPDPALLAARGVAYLGPVAELDHLPDEVAYVIGVGSGPVRRKIAAAAGDRLAATVIHPNVHRGFDVQIGAGSVICSHVSIENHVRLGEHVHVNQNSTIGHDCVLADFTTVSPLVAVSGNVTTGPGAFLGTGSSIIQGVAIGEDAVTGAGAAVIHDVPAATTVVGVPARPAG